MIVSLRRTLNVAAFLARACSAAPVQAGTLARSPILPAAIRLSAASRIDDRRRPETRRQPCDCRWSAQGAATDIPRHIPLRAQ